MPKNDLISALTSPLAEEGTAEQPSRTLVRVALPVPVHTLFDYFVPSDQVQPELGSRVSVPFGPRKLIGVCVALNPSDAHQKPRAIHKVLDSSALVDANLRGMAQWLSDYYHHPLGEVYATLLPGAARKGSPTTAPTQPAWQADTAPQDLARAPKQLALYEFIRQASAPVTRDTLIANGFSSALLNTLTKRGGLTKVEVPKSPPGQPAAPDTLETPLKLNSEQNAALTALRANTGYRTILLDGVTGSGKTEVYLQFIADIIAGGQQALVLVPEIALTPQTVGRFQRRFGNAAALHSQLGDNERWQIWLGCRDGSIPVVIGTRSAALTPFANLGLIVVDEEHDGSFKQTDGLRYSARDLSVKRAHDLGIPLLLGSATPALESLYNAKQGRYQHLHLTERAGGAALPTYRVLDIRGQQAKDGISEPLKRVIRQHLDAGNQALLFINRRGYSPSLLCNSCGVACTCADCDLPMTYHRKTAHRNAEHLACHHCSRQQGIPEQCTSCGLAALQPVGVGTQRTEQGVAEAFPDIPIYRIDRDTVRSARALEAQFAAIRGGQPALLVGTQMLAKGHHFPDVTLVGVLNADAGFASADFRAPERTAALIVQVAGRAGREEKKGEVWIQTMQPESPMLQALVTEGYSGFAARELAQRSAAGLPPAAYMTLVRAESEDANIAGQFLTQLAAQLTQQAAQAELTQVQIMGPVPAPIPRVSGRIRLQLLILSDERRSLHRLLTGLRDAPKTPSNLRWSVDVDPYDAF